jgi:RimJ/RimL family protein N-acetyltransferase
MVIIDRVARRMLRNCPRRRIQATTDPEFGPGQRWLLMLGFVQEGRLRAYTPDGRDQLMYARIR